MFWYGVIVGVIFSAAILGGWYVFGLKVLGVSDREVTDILMTVSETKGNRAAVVEVWKNCDYETGKSEFVGQVFLEKK